MRKKPKPHANWRWACEDKRRSPVVGTPVYVKDDALKKYNFPREHRGGVIVEDWSMYDPKGKLHHRFLVKHKIGEFFWGAEDLVEIGGLKLKFADEKD